MGGAGPRPRRARRHAAAPAGVWHGRQPPGPISPPARAERPAGARRCGESADTAWPPPRRVTGVPAHASWGVQPTAGGPCPRCSGVAPPALCLRQRGPAGPAARRHAGGLPPPLATSVQAAASGRPAPLPSLAIPVISPTVWAPNRPAGALPCGATPRGPRRRHRPAGACTASKPRRPTRRCRRPRARRGHSARPDSRPCTRGRLRRALVSSPSRRPGPQSVSICRHLGAAPPSPPTSWCHPARRGRHGRVDLRCAPSPPQPLRPPQGAGRAPRLVFVAVKCRRLPPPALVFPLWAACVSISAAGRRPVAWRQRQPHRLAGRPPAAVVTAVAPPTPSAAVSPTAFAVGRRGLRPGRGANNW